LRGDRSNRVGFQPTGGGGGGIFIFSTEKDFSVLFVIITSQNNDNTVRNAAL